MLTENKPYTLLLLGWLRSSYEKDQETGLHYAGARYYDSRLSIFNSTDPLWWKSPDKTSYHYCSNNPIMFVDPDGRNPIYDLDGNFMGTDDRGLKGEYIIMKKKDFTQGMSYRAAKENSYLGSISDESRQRIWDHHARLVERPDYDGIVSIAEGIAWAKYHPNALKNPTPDNTLYIDAAKIDFGNLSVKNISLNEGQKGNVNLLAYVNLLSYNSRISTYALGNTQMKLLNTERGTVQLFRDVYNWDYHNDFINGIPQGKRDKLIYLERVRAGLNDSHGFPIFIYGIGHIKTK